MRTEYLGNLIQSETRQISCPLQAGSSATARGLEAPGSFVPFDIGHRTRILVDLAQIGYKLRREPCWLPAF